MAFDLDGFVKDLGVTGDEEAAVRAAFGKPERLTVLEKGYLRQSDYSKSQDTLRAEREKLQAANDRVSAEAAEWARMMAETGTVTKAMQDKLDAAEAKALKLTQRVTRIAAEAGLDEKKALEGIDTAPPPNPPPAAPVIDAGKYVAAEQYAQFGKYMFDLVAELPMLASEHQTLTGQPLDTRALRAEIEKRATQKGANLDPRAIWEEMHGIPQKRETAAQAARAKEREADEQRGYERARTEQALPVAPSAGVHSPVLKQAGEAKSVLNRPVPESSIRSAAEALRSGKYRQPAGAQK